jgi:hypothetical protein
MHLNRAVEGTIRPTLSMGDVHKPVRTAECLFLVFFF